MEEDWEDRLEGGFEELPADREDAVEGRRSAMIWGGAWLVFEVDDEDEDDDVIDCVEPAGPGVTEVGGKGGVPSSSSSSSSLTPPAIARAVLLFIAGGRTGFGDVAKVTLPPTAGGGAP